MHQKTQEILDYFKAISSIPRCSGKEDTISQWLQQWAAEKGFALTNLSDDNERFKPTVQGLKGGHSGIDIHRRRANARKICVGRHRGSQAGRLG